jgi:hypothetical protein
MIRVLLGEALAQRAAVHLPLRAAVHLPLREEGE